MHEIYYTQSDLLKMGFSKKIIEELLSEPVLKRNPYYLSGPPMKLFLKEEVETAKSSIQFKEHMHEFEQRRKSANKAVETKKNLLMKEINEKIARIDVVKVNHVHSKALLEKELWESRYDNYVFNSSSANKETQACWVVNYIRHNLTGYDRVLYGAKGKVGIKDAYKLYRSAVLDEIAKVYPEYTKECQRQKSDHSI